MAAYLVRGGSAYAREEKQAIGHCVVSSDQSSGCGLAQKVAATRWLNREKFTGMLGFQSCF